MVDTQIVNGTTVIINEIIDYSWIIAIVIALITLGGIIWSGLQTRKSNNLLDIDIKNRLRPFIQITDILPNTVTLQNNGIISWENYIHSTPKPSIKYVAFKGELKNLGSVPALDIKPKWLKRNSKIVRNDLDNGQEDPNFPLGVKESYPLTATITTEDYWINKNVL